jgi:hypothetical protein
MWLYQLLKNLKTNKMTAVEWLKSEMLKPNLSMIDILEQAKEMEKEQLECAWNSSDQNMRFQFSSSAYKPITFKQWLEIFKEE